MSNYKYDNGAYSADTTADTSFSLDISGLCANTVYYVNFNDDFSDLNKMRLMFSLQGLLNRDYGLDEAHTSLLFVDKDDSDAFWFNYSTREKSELVGLEKVVINTWEDFFNTFINQIKYCGFILWDGNVPATANAAATVCALDGYLPVLSGCALENQLREAGVSEKMSLCGKFNGRGIIYDTPTKSTGSAKCDTYIWAMEKYYDRCSSKYIAYTLDGVSCVENNPYAGTYYERMCCVENHDFLIARRCFFFDLSPYKGETPCDDKNQPVGTDYETMKLIFARRFQRANGEIGQIFGFPPWWLKYTAAEKYADGSPLGTKHPVWIEWLFTEIITCYNLAKEADAASPPFMTNGSFFYKYRLVLKEYKNNRPKEKLTFDKNIHYYTIYVGDYDSSAWLKHHVYHKWTEDDKRGKIDLMWAFNPNLSYRVPMIFDYIHENKTEHDYFVAGDSGAGYVMPSGLIAGRMMPYMEECRPAENGDAREKWIDYCAAFYEKFDLDITGFIINGLSEVDKETLEMFNSFSPTGSLFNATRVGIFDCDGVTYSCCHSDFPEMHNYENEYYNAFTRMEGYNFSAFRTVIHTPSNIYQITHEFEEFAAKRGKKVKYVDMYTYFDLIKQSGQAEKL